MSVGTCADCGRVYRPTERAQNQCVLCRERHRLERDLEETRADLRALSAEVIELSAERCQLLEAIARLTNERGAPSIAAAVSVPSVPLDCGQSGECATPPGCVAHWERLTRSLFHRLRETATDPWAVCNRPTAEGGNCQLHACHEGACALPEATPNGVAAVVRPRCAALTHREHEQCTRPAGHTGTHFATVDGGSITWLDEGNDGDDEGHDGDDEGHDGDDEGHDDDDEGHDDGQGHGKGREVRAPRRRARLPQGGGECDREQGHDGTHRIGPSCTRGERRGAARCRTHGEPWDSARGSCEFHGWRAEWRGRRIVTPYGPSDPRQLLLTEGTP